jgi:hypothetical protein
MKLLTYFKLFFSLIAKFLSELLIIMMSVFEK